MVAIIKSTPMIQEKRPRGEAVAAIIEQLETKALSPGLENVGRAQNNRTGFSAPISASGDQPASEILFSNQELDSSEEDRPSRGRARAHLGTSENTHPGLSDPANSNALDNSQTPTKRAWKLQKPVRSDLRRRTTTLAIPWNLYEQGRGAYGNAQIRNHDLDTLVTLRPKVMDDLDPEQREAWFRAQVNKIRTMYADNDDLPEFAYLWSRESKRIGTARKAEGVGEHLHMILASGGRPDLVERYLRKHLTGPEVDVRPVDAVSRRLRNGQIGDASTYVLKAVEPAYWRAYPQTPHRPSGPIYGQRVGWSRNLLDEQPIGRKARKRQYRQEPRTGPLTAGATAGPSNPGKGLLAFP